MFSPALRFLLFTFFSRGATNPPSSPFLSVTCWNTFARERRKHLSCQPAQSFPPSPLLPSLLWRRAGKTFLTFFSFLPPRPFFFFFLRPSQRRSFSLFTPLAIQLMQLASNGCSLRIYKEKEGGIEWRGKRERERERGKRRRRGFKEKLCLKGKRSQKGSQKEISASACCWKEGISLLSYFFSASDGPNGLPPIFDCPSMPLSLSLSSTSFERRARKGWRDHFREIAGSLKKFK